MQLSVSSFTRHSFPCQLSAIQSLQSPETKYFAATPISKKLFLRVNGHIRCVSLRTHLLLLVLLLFYILLSARRACVLVVHDRRCCTRHCGRCKENIWEESHSYSYHHSNASLVLLLCGFHGNLPNRSLFQEDNLFYDPSAHMLRRVLFS